LYSENFLLYFISPSFYSSSSAQQSLNGQVLDAEKKQPVASANVYLANSSVGTITDEKGNFLIKNFPAGRYDLVVSCIGYVTQVITVSAAQLPPILTVMLKPAVNELQEVVVEPYEKNGWEKWGSFFMENFIGTHAFASDCKFRNPEAVKFRMSKKRNTLRAIANEQLIIENKALGYILKYDLVNFEYNFTTKVLLYQGYPLFEEMDAKRSGQERRWNRNREDVYGGSVMHFMRSLYRNKLLEEHFEVRRIFKVSDAEKKRVRQLYRPGDPSLRNDTAAYYRKVLNDPESLTILIDKILPGDSIAYAIDSVTVGFSFKGYLEVKFPPKYTPAEYRKFLPRGVQSMPLTSEVFLTTSDPISVLYNGSFFEPTGMITSGYWGWAEKMCTMLPSDYWPPSKKKNPVSNCTGF